MDSITAKVRHALNNLGYTGGTVEMNRIGYNRFFVIVDGERIGVFDSGKELFVE